MGHTPILTDTWNFQAQLLHSNVYKEYFNPEQQGQWVRLQRVGVELFGAASLVVFFNTRIAASRPTRSSEGDPSCALRHSSCSKHSSQPLSDDKNILDYVWGQTVIQQQLNTVQIGNSVHVSYRVVLHPIHQSSRTIRRDILLLREEARQIALWGVNPVGLQRHIIWSLSHWGINDNLLTVDCLSRPWTSAPSGLQNMASSWERTIQGVPFPTRNETE
jgi:hypothetical protein